MAMQNNGVARLLVADTQLKILSSHGSRGSAVVGSVTEEAGAVMKFSLFADNKITHSKV